MNVYFSNLDFIKFQNNNSGGMDYTLQQPEEGFPTGLTNPPPFEDDILKMINQHQQQQQFDKPRLSHNPEDEEKFDTEDSEKNGFDPNLLRVFTQPTTQPETIDKHIFQEPRTIPTRDPNNYPQQRPNFIRHTGPKLTAPPGLIGLGFGHQPEDRPLIPSSGSFTQLNQVPSPNKNTQPFRSTTNFGEVSRSSPPRSVTTIGQFDARRSFQINNMSEFGFNAGESPQGRTVQPNYGPGPGGPIGVQNGSQLTQESNDGSPDSLSHQSLFDLIEREIALDLTSRMKNLDINAPQTQTQPPNLGNAIYEDPFKAGNPINPVPTFNNSFPDNIEDKKSQILYVKGLEDNDTTTQMIYNLFSNFGNVLKVMFIRSRAAALLEYENVEYATIARDYLNNIVLMRKPLRIFFSNYSIVNLRHKKVSKDSIEEVLIGNPKTFRFKKNKNISINPPSATLHISNLAQEVSHEQAIHEFFGPYGTILALKFLLIDNSKYQCLMKMGSIEESVNIMAILHDMEFGGRRVQLSFTRSKI